MSFISERRKIRLIVFEVLATRLLDLDSINSGREVWSEIFRRVFGEGPSDDMDPRWNTLLLRKARGGRYNALRLARLYLRVGRA